MDQTASPERLRVGGDDMTLWLSGTQSGDRLMAYEVEIGPGGGPPALHRHDSLELVRVEQGELVVYLGDERVLAAAPAVVTIPGGSEHTIRNESAGAARAFVVMAPGTEMERFARAAASSEPEEMLALAAAHGIEITRPLAAP
jgi:mannose-6-phosphate isomerase-like protein (cupin superfamily)